MGTLSEQHSGILQQIADTLYLGKTKRLQEILHSALEEGVSAPDILEQGLLMGMRRVAEDFKDDIIFVPQVLLCTRSMHMAMELLHPLLVNKGIQPKGKACIGTIQGDLHDIGKNLVKIMMESQGMEVVDLGVDVPPSLFVETAIRENCDVICCSALLTSTMWFMREIITAAEKAGVRDRIKIMVGGAPVTERFCRQIGADAYSVNAAEAAEIALRFCAEKKQRTVF